MELRPGPYDRPNGESRRGAERGPPEREESCPFCRWPVEKWWPLIYAPVVELGAETWRSCHLKCLLDALRRDEEHPRAAGVETSFGESVLELVTRAEKALFSRKPSARLGLEDERMCLAAQSTLPPTWPYEELRPIPKATFFLQGVLELRLSCSPQLVEIPPNLGRSTDLESLCLISNSLTSLPSEVGMLRELRFLYLNGNFLRRIPQAVSDLPKLQEICFDANCLEELPHFTAQLRLFTAPGNHLTEVAFWPQLERLEVHGNRLQRLLPLSWHSTSQLVTLKVMGNQLTELPEEVGHMPVLRILGVASNRLRSLPHALAESRELEWLLAYENQLEELPPFGPRNWRLTRLLLESNPLRPVAVQSLVSDLSRSYIKTLGLDSNQVAVPELPDPLPAAVSVGTVIPISGQSQLSLKLTKASRLRRSTDRAESDHPELLIVAFAASQGEPEWLGFLRRLYEVGEVKPCCHRSSLDFAEEADFDARMARLWTHCTQEASTEAPPEETPALPLGDFDVLVQKLELPDSFFYDLDLQFSQFDFDGDGSLNAEETSCMVKSVLKERRSSAGGKPEDVDVDLLVPYRTLQDGGYVVVRELGRGGQGVMYLGKKEPQSNWLVCRQSDDDTEYCIKFYYKKDSNAGSIHEVVDEFSRMKEFDNEHVARTYETFQDQDFYYLVNEPYFGGDWTKLACKAYESNVHMTEDWWRHLYYQCVEGLDYLHKKAQMHCDIKEPNLMIKFAHDFRRPQVVYIDFGLSQAFARKVENITGTPGYIPPETWDEKAWYPNGDIFSLGVVFFQMLSGRVPSDDGSVRGIFQEANDFSQLAMLTKTAPPPWQIFPRWGQLQQMVAKMLDKRKENRPRAAALLHDPWFSSTSSSALPAENLSQIVRKSKEALCRSELVNEMCERCNLQELRSMQARLDQLRQFGQAAPAIPSVSTAKFVEVACSYGIDQFVLQNFTTHVAKGPFVNYVGLLNDVIKEKEKRSNQLVTNLFNEMDRNGDGRLSRQELRAMLESDAFECDYEDVDEVLENMDDDGDGYVDFEEMKRAIMEDGRIAVKDEADRGERPQGKLFGPGLAERRCAGGAPLAAQEALRARVGSSATLDSHCVGCAVPTIWCWELLTGVSLAWMLVQERLLTLRAH